MKRLKYIVLSAVLLFSFSVCFTGCGADPDNAESSPENTITSSLSGGSETTVPAATKKVTSRVEVQWKKMSFQEVILASNTAFVGTIQQMKAVPETAQIEAVFHVDRDLFGNIPEEIIYCYLWGSDVSPGSHSYRVGGQYLMLTGAQNHQFYPHTMYFPVSDLFLDIANNQYMLLGEKLEFSNADTLCEYVRATFLKSKEVEQIETGAGDAEGNWESAAFVAKVRLEFVIKEASPLFHGTSYVAEVIEIISGDQGDLQMHNGNRIYLVLAEGEAKTGDVITVGFSAKYEAGTVYTQEGPDTIVKEE